MHSTAPPQCTTVITTTQECEQHAYAEQHAKAQHYLRLVQAPEERACLDSTLLPSVKTHVSVPLVSVLTFSVNIIDIT